MEFVAEAHDILPVGRRGLLACGLRIWLLIVNLFTPYFHSRWDDTELMLMDDMEQTIADIKFEIAVCSHEVPCDSPYIKRI